MNAYLSPAATEAIKGANAAHHARLADLRRERIYQRLIERLRGPIAGPARGWRYVLRGGEFVWTLEPQRGDADTAEMSGAEFFASVIGTQS